MRHKLRAWNRYLFRPFNVNGRIEKSEENAPGRPRELVAERVI